MALTTQKQAVAVPYLSIDVPYLDLDFRLRLAASFRSFLAFLTVPPVLPTVRF